MKTNIGGRICSVSAFYLLFGSR